MHRRSWFAWESPRIRILAASAALFQRDCPRNLRERFAEWRRHVSAALDEDHL